MVLSAVRNFVSGVSVATAVVFAATLSAPVHAATIGPGVLDFNQVEIACQSKGKKSKCIASAVLIGNSGEDTVTSTYEDLFGVSVVEWDRFEQDSGLTSNGRVTVETGVAPGNTTDGVNRWFISDTLLDPSSVVGFSFKAGTYSVFFSFIEPGLAAGDEVRFNDFDYYADMLLSDEEYANLSNKANAGLSNLIVYGVTAIPVPAAFPLAAAGFGLLGIMGWRKNRQSA
ncbi:hypothetical protein EOI86_00485 [Hwanghaeella grinnelliae]|uniref:VPLPA-CTERM sorting domain-containing protein n=1 Tax=Hwanghaeella grinnelliae TaxID=2500179 RepID=A0A437QTH9_9PROT|nr:PEP-CTERM sorting domain-containing protein [Hwanghaeella grinnelliae]RVU37817.1 hypothetical protein EOI86_00485 [Hwanghaeella grinnelliae]